MKNVNQEKLANALNLSKATISRCFTNHPGINPATRARVFELASQMGYRHRTTRVLNSRRSSADYQVGVLICTDDEEYYRSDYESPGRRLLKGISECSQVEGINISVHFLNPSILSPSENQYVELFNKVGRSWNGLLLLYPFPDALLSDLGHRFPIVSLVEQSGVSRLNCVDVDHYQGISLAISHLYELGHRRIAFYTKPYQVEASWSLRRAGAYFEKLTQLGLEIRQEDMINMHPKNLVSLEASFDKAVQSISNGVTAIICAADHQAYDLIRGLEARGVSVPEDVSVMGFDGIKSPAGMPELSTVEIPYHDIGYTATKRLKDLMNRRFGPIQHILLSCQNKVGTTTSSIL